jgi:hypothetical protein
LELIDFINQYFIAEMPRFEGEANHNIFPGEEDDNNTPPFTEEYKTKATQTVRMHNRHKCAVAVNGCKKEISHKCRRGYSNEVPVRETYLNENTNRIVYRRRTTYDLKVVPYNLAMIMDWDSHINVEYSDSAYAALYMYKYCYKGPAKLERIELSIDKEQDSLDEQKLFI